MPYIKPETRVKYDTLIDHLTNQLADAATIDSVSGDLNYMITRVLLGGMLKVVQRQTGGGWRYEHLNKIHGVLNAAEREIYRRLTGPYEDGAIAKNGDLKEFSTES